MTLAVAIMYLVAGAFAAIGAGLLVALRRPGSEARTYAFRMTGIMALAFGVALAGSATVMWSWGPPR